MAQDADFLGAAAAGAGTLLLRVVVAFPKRNGFRKCSTSAEGLTCACSGFSQARGRSRRNIRRPICRRRSKRTARSIPERPSTMRWPRAAFATGASRSSASLHIPLCFRSRSARLSIAHANHPARLCRRLELHRRMDGYAAAADPRQRRRAAESALCRLLLRRSDGRRHQRSAVLLREP